jgi:hypothetical protein
MVAPFYLLGGFNDSHSPFAMPPILYRPRARRWVRVEDEHDDENDTEVC